ncbi:hypothetical protein VaNZ11_009745 [Volvox africanus]|uniref:Uncharacterized protein n=1 Tax=Volvox africanus TaxID=51714 RepID=A0ABQ5S965_9CHLO|nr:hypothetical protein VaNZ11_009745 [Volvox africanus]
MAYVYFVPPAAPLPPVQERTSLCSPSQSTGFICGPILIFVGGATALMIGFFERKPAIIWPIISCGICLTIIGVFLARRHVKHWREQEQERLRAMWRTNRSQPGDPRWSVGDGTASGAAYPGFDVPMYCLEAPSRPLVRPSAERSPGSSQYGNSTAQLYDSEYWCALAVPLRPDNVTSGEYLDWAAMTLVVQPHFKFVRQPPPSSATAAATAAAAASGGGGSVSDAVVAIEPGVGVLTRTMHHATHTGCSGFAGGADNPGTMEHVSAPILSSVSVALVRVPSVGSRSAHGSLQGGGGGGSERRTRRGSRPGRMGDLISLFVAVAGTAGGGGDDVNSGVIRPTDVDENGVELAGTKGMAAAAAAAPRYLHSPQLPPPQSPLPQSPRLQSPPPGEVTSAALVAFSSVGQKRGGPSGPYGSGCAGGRPSAAAEFLTDTPSKPRLAAEATEAVGSLNTQGS